MKDEDLKCKDCKAPIRHPGCHSSCEYYQAWKDDRDNKLAKERKYKWLDRLSRPLKPKRKTKIK